MSGHADALGVQEAFEEQPVADGVDVRDAQHVGDHAAEAGPRRVMRGMPCSAANRAMSSTIEEVARIAHLADDPEFVFEAGLQFGRDGVVPLLHPVERQLAQVGVRAVVPFRQGKWGNLNWPISSSNSMDSAMDTVFCRAPETWPNNWPITRPRS